MSNTETMLSALQIRTLTKTVVADNHYADGMHCMSLSYKVLTLNICFVFWQPPLVWHMLVLLQLFATMLMTVDPLLVLMT